jgi:hypothetical protein
MMNLARAVRSAITTILLLSANAFAADNELSAAEREQGWMLLFDGKTTRGWHSFGKNTFPEKGWQVRDGRLDLVGGSKAGDIVSEKTFSEFDLTWEWKIESGGNNGIKYFVSNKRKEALGHEYQMIDDKAGHDFGPLHSTAAFYDVLAPDPNKPLNPPGEWNRSRVLVQGNHVEHWLNGKRVLEYELGSPEVLAAVQKSKFKSVPGFGTRQEGHIMLTYHSDPVSYRNIKIRDLSATKP